MEDKKPWQSKTLWVALIQAVVAFLPGIQAWIAANPAIYGVALSGVFIVLRLVSGGKIVISDDSKG